MCVCCDNDHCLCGEVCARRAGLVKYYRANNIAATSALGRPAEWEHVIPRAVINKLSYWLKYEYNPLLMYRFGVVFALDKGAHRGAMSGAGGGITSTGRSATAQGWAGYIAGLLNDFQGDEAISCLIQDEVYAINIFRRYAYWGFGEEISGVSYIASLGAVLYDYAKWDIVSWECLGELYNWLYGELDMHPGRIAY